MFPHLGFLPWRRGGGTSEGGGGQSPFPQQGPAYILRKTKRRLVGLTLPWEKPEHFEFESRIGYPKLHTFMNPFPLKKYIYTPCVHYLFLLGGKYWDWYSPHVCMHVYACVYVCMRMFVLLWIQICMYASKRLCAYACMRVATVLEPAKYERMAFWGG